MFDAIACQVLVRMLASWSGKSAISFESSSPQLRRPNRVDLVVSRKSMRWLNCSQVMGRGRWRVKLPRMLSLEVAAFG